MSDQTIGEFFEEAEAGPLGKRFGPSRPPADTKLDRKACDAAGMEPIGWWARLPDGTRSRGNDSRAPLLWSLRPLEVTGTVAERAYLPVSSDPAASARLCRAVLKKDWRKEPSQPPPSWAPAPCAPHVELVVEQTAERTIATLWIGQDQYKGKAATPEPAIAKAVAAAGKTKEAVCRAVDKGDL